MVNRLETITIIGAGHGGKAMAAHLALMGADVTLYNRTCEEMCRRLAKGMGFI